MDPGPVKRRELKHCHDRLGCCGPLVDTDPPPFSPLPLDFTLGAFTSMAPPVLRPELPGFGVAEAGADAFSMFGCRAPVSPAALLASTAGPAM